jgi:hypothetical protein
LLLNEASQLRCGVSRFPLEARKEAAEMTKLLLALGSAMVALTVTAAEAQGEDATHIQCAKWRHGQCVSSLGPGPARGTPSSYSVGHLFGPNYSYSNMDSVPPSIVARYHLRSRFRYVKERGHLYVVDPRTYRVVRVIEAPF